MLKEIIISSTASQNRIAITEDRKLVDFFVEHPEKDRMVGNIYLGKVARVLPGIRAVFINIGLKHDAFLHFSDIGDSLKDNLNFVDDDYVAEPDVKEEVKNSKPDSENGNVENQEVTKARIPRLKKGQEVLVQIIKEPVKGKGVRVSTSISIPGRFCVLIPYEDKIGISKKITDYREKKRLKKLARGIIPSNCGLIVRTASKDQPEDSLSSDLKYLSNTWVQVQDEVKKNSPPYLVYKDLSTTISVIRDLFTTDVSNIFIDSKKLYKEIRAYVNTHQPDLVDKVNLYKSSNPIYEEFKVEEQIKGMMNRQVPLPSGGYLFIEHTEAMTVVDVNSGRYAAKKEQEQNSLKTDLEAAREIARHLRLRDIGGLLVVDFIDLEEDKNRRKIYDELRKEFKRDRAKIAMLPMTDFGIMQITRQRIRENIMQSTHELCHCCNGTGLMQKKSNLINELDQWIQRYKNDGKKNSLRLLVHNSLGLNLRIGAFSTMKKLQLKYFLRIRLEEKNDVNPQSFRFIDSKTEKEITNDYL
ncbi:MAG: Rne/Rng family ribonuclease [Melioribacteraceae bacterium]|jgi:ribonuclease G|nr:Rne/Rng family ribonuclease [Melioribacteraceae bacterium]